jgi:hypothetical protein
MRLLALRMGRFLMLIPFKKQALWYWHGRFSKSSSLLKLQAFIASTSYRFNSDDYARC